MNEFLEHNWSLGKTAKQLLTDFSLYGEDPVIMPANYPEGRKFSAREYAQETAAAICSKLEMEGEATDVQSCYQDAIKFAARRHVEQDQRVPGTDLPYVVHLSNVAMEIFMAARHSENFNLQKAIQIALLHDTIEDTSTTFDELKEHFGEEVAEAVMALTKDKSLPKDQQIKDSLNRIRRLPHEVWAVKLADRITNLQPPPSDWSIKKRRNYLEESKLILDSLGEWNEYLTKRLKVKIDEYRYRYT